MSTRALRTAASGMYAQQINIEVISNNIANMNTTGFKRNKAEFQDLMYQEVSVNPLATSSSGMKDSGTNLIQVGNGVQPGSTQKIFKQGDITATNNQFDIAIQGEGFFQVKKTDGTFAYTRDGSFKVNSEGKLITSGGYLLDPDLSLTENTLGIAISRDGSVVALEVGGGSAAIGDIQLARFLNPGGLV
ncbi:MAG: flagellar hook-basal body complex protein, partial [Ignavibacteriaceae bacterium]|nr:flagellar hook-basal body complex protein [Ignavibacteriaceae bacterium]